METEGPTHLLSSLGVLAQFRIAKRVSKEELSKIKNKINRVYKEKDPEKLKQLITDALIESTRKHLSSTMPPGLILPKKNLKKEALDNYYMELSAVSQSFANKLVKQKMTKLDVCFIVNAIVNILGIGEDDFAEFHKRFQKYKDNNFDDEDEE